MVSEFVFKRSGKFGKCYQSARSHHQAYTDTSIKIIGKFKLQSETTCHLIAKHSAEFSVVLILTVFVNSEPLKLESNAPVFTIAARLSLFHFLSTHSYNQVLPSSSSFSAASPIYGISTILCFCCPFSTTSAYSQIFVALFLMILVLIFYSLDLSSNGAYVILSLDINRFSSVSSFILIYRIYNKSILEVNLTALLFRESHLKVGTFGEQQIRILSIKHRNKSKNIQEVL